MRARVLIRIGGFILAVTAALTALLGVPAAASAHDELVSSTPANGATVRVLPRVVVLVFAEPPVAGYTKAHIAGPAGQDLSAGAPVTAGSRVSLGVRPSSARGSYVIRWSLLSDDGHPVSGLVRFTVGTVATPTAPAATSATHVSTAGSGWIVASLVALAALGVVFGVTRLSEGATRSRSRRADSP